jgi:hypothetical protein
MELQRVSKRQPLQLAEDYRKLLYVLEIVRVLSKNDGHLFTSVGGKYHNECLWLSSDGLVDNVASAEDQRMGIYRWMAT